MRDDSIDNYTLSSHVMTRMSQRGIREDDIRYAIKSGKKRHSKGACFFFVGRKNVDRSHQKLNGLHVLIEENVIVTAYKNKKTQWE